jgi:ribosomal protein L10
MTKIKESARKFGHITSIKNTLLKIFLQKNDIHTTEDFSGHTYAFFCQDVFEGINLMEKVLQDLKIEEKFILQCIFVNKYFIPQNTITNLSNCQNKYQLYTYAYSMFSSFVLPAVNAMHIISQESSDK